VQDHAAQVEKVIRNRIDALITAVGPIVLAHLAVLITELAAVGTQEQANTPDKGLKG
jgi:hypothetical protein